MEHFLYDLFEDADIICGDCTTEKPPLCNFKNADKAITMLNKHIKGNLPIAVHSDVDVDGIGSTYEIFKMLTWLGVIHKTGLIINKDKVHGISSKHSEYFKNNKVGLLIVLDSSSNELEHIKNMNCDVLVIDHHELVHNELCGDTVGGEYVIVSNMVDNEDTSALYSLIEDPTAILQPYKAEKRMSCGLVIYELLRLYQLANKMENLIESNMLYQWAGVTLFTDVIPLSNARNQYYIERTVHTFEVEPALKQMVKQINKYQSGLDKTFINFYLAPRINKAIRAGASQEALDIVLNRPGDIRLLDKYKQLQDEATKDIEVGLDKNDRYVLKDITDTNISRSYCGVIAAKLCDMTRKNAVVCIKNNKTGLLEGSFRGRLSGPDYRGYFESCYPDIYAQGHSSAFGFKATKEQLEFLMNSLYTIEPKENEHRFYLTAGEMPDELKGTHHIEDMTEFKRQRGLVKLAMSNSKLSSEESVNIMILNPGDLKIDWRGKVGYYNILGLKCMAFEEVTTKWLSIYVEYTNDISVYVKNVKV